MINRERVRAEEALLIVLDRDDDAMRKQIMLEGVFPSVKAHIAKEIWR